MFKKLTLAALTAALAIATVRAAAIRYFYYWTDSQHGLSSWSGWLNAGQTSCYATASFSDPNQAPKILHLEAWRNKNTPQGEKEVIADYYITNYTGSVSIGPMDPQLYKYAIARITVNNGAGGVIYADCTAN